MDFKIKLADADSVHPFDIGEISIADPVTGATSGPISPKKRYMPFIELMSIYAFLESLALGGTQKSYVLSSGEVIVFHQKTQTVSFEFVGLTIEQSVTAAIVDLRAAMSVSLARLSTFSDQNNGVIEDLKMGLERASQMVR